MKTIPTINSTTNEEENKSQETILGRVFVTGPTSSENEMTRVLVHLTNQKVDSGEVTNSSLFEKFIIPNVGLDMPIY